MLVNLLFGSPLLDPLIDEYHAYLDVPLRERRGKPLLPKRAVTPLDNTNCASTTSKSPTSSNYLLVRPPRRILFPKMRVAAILFGLAVLSAQGARILQSNDDGWAELYVRSFHDALNEAGHDVVLSAPAENMSGTGAHHHHHKTRIPLVSRWY